MKLIDSKSIVEFANGDIFDDKNKGLLKATFETMLVRSLENFRVMKKRGVWLELDVHLFENCLDVALKCGFVLHHCKSGGRTIMLNMWLPEGEKSPMPPYASHYIGVGVFVYDEEDDTVLVVKEKYGHTGTFKYVTGLVDLGEFVHQAVVREVKEETGLDVKFDHIIALKENAQWWQFNTSDILFFCRATIVDKSQVIKPQAAEIEEAKWMPLSEFLKSSPFTVNSGSDKKKNNVWQELLTLAIKEIDVKESNNNNNNNAHLTSKELPIGYRAGHNIIHHSSNI